MDCFGNSDGSNIIFNIHTAFMVLLVTVVVIAIIKTFPRLISRTRKNKDTGTIKKRVDKAFDKVESKISKQ